MAVIQRSQGIGASEVAAIAGASPWMTPVALWMLKVGLAGADRPDTPQMAAGRALEAPLLRLGSDQLGVKLRANHVRLPHPDWPAVPLYATPDGFGPGRTVLAEVKVVGHKFSDWADGVPGYVQIQVQAQLACVPQATRCHVIALVGGALRTFTIEPDQVAQEALPAMVAEWWQRHVVEQMAPAASGPDDAWALLRANVLAGPERMQRLATPGEQRDGQQLLALLDERARLDQRIEEARVSMAALAKDVDVAGVGWTGKWTERSTTEWKALVASLGISQDVLAGFQHRTPVFTFRRQGDAP